MRSKVRQKLRSTWRNYVSKNCVPEWMDFEEFFDWAIEEGGGEPGVVIQRPHRRKPYGPDNCKFYVPQTHDKEVFEFPTFDPAHWDELCESIKKAPTEKWNAMVLRVRKEGKV